MSPLTTVRLAVAGSRSDAARIVLTALGAALGTIALLASATVLAVTPGGRYTNDLLNDAGLRPGVAAALILLTVPLLAFVAQCSRLGAPARDRRLAAIRLAGGTPNQVVGVAAAETGLATVLGVGVGFGVYLVGRRLLDRPDAAGRRPVPTDVLPVPTWLMVIAVGVPLFVTLLAVVTLRRVAFTPLGVVRSTRTGRPSMAPGVLIVAGVGACALVEPVNRYLTHQGRSAHTAFTVLAVLAVVGVLLVSVGVVTGAGWITYAVGRLLHRVARRPAGLLAGRRMMADPWAGSRTFAALLVTLVIGALAAAMRALTSTDQRVAEENNRRMSALLGERYIPADTAFFDRAYDLVGYAVLVAVVIAAAGLLVALADGVVARRRTLAALTAAGTPRGVLARALGWQVLAPIAPAVALAVSAGVLLPRQVFGHTISAATMSVVRCVPPPGDPVTACADTAYARAHGVTYEAPTFVMPVPVPWADLALLVGGALAATLVITAVGLLFLRMSTKPGELRTT